MPIVIVDNASPNHSGEQLRERLKEDSNIHLIFSDKNIGFARGNNLGYDFAKNRLHGDVIVVLNNDITIEQIDFIDKLIYIYHAYPFDVLGPDIYSTATFSHQSPPRMPSYTLSSLNRDILKWNFIQFVYTALSKFHFLYMLDQLYKKAITARHQKRNEHAPVNWSHSQTSVRLHGAFLIFANHFVKNETHAFYPGTFLYMEEDFLDFYCKKKGYRVTYCPELHVLHREHSSTKKSFTTEYAAKLFTVKNMLESASLLKRFLRANANDRHISDWGVS